MPVVEEIFCVKVVVDVNGSHGLTIVEWVEGNPEPAEISLWTDPVKVHGLYSFMRRLVLKELK